MMSTDEALKTINKRSEERDLSTTSVGSFNREWFLIPAKKGIRDFNSTAPHFYVDDSTSESDCFVSDYDELDDANLKLIRYNNYVYKVFKRSSYRSWKPLNGKYPDILNVRQTGLLRYRYCDDSDSDYSNVSTLNSVLVNIHKYKTPEKKSLNDSRFKSSSNVKENTSHKISRSKNKPTDILGISAVNKLSDSKNLKIKTDNSAVSHDNSFNNKLNNNNSVSSVLQPEVSSDYSIVSCLDNQSVIVNVSELESSKQVRAKKEMSLLSSSSPSSNSKKRKREPSGSENKHVSDTKRKRTKVKSIADVSKKQLQIDDYIKKANDKNKEKNNYYNTDSSSSEVFINKHQRSDEKVLNYNKEVVEKKNIFNRSSQNNQRCSSLSEDEGISSEHRNDISSTELSGLGTQEIDFVSEKISSNVNNDSLSDSDDDEIDKSVINLLKGNTGNFHQGKVTSTEISRNQGKKNSSRRSTSLTNSYDENSCKKNELKNNSEHNKNNSTSGNFSNRKKMSETSVKNVSGNEEKLSVKSASNKRRFSPPSSSSSSEEERDNGRSRNSDIRKPSDSSPAAIKIKQNKSPASISRERRRRSSDSFSSCSEDNRRKEKSKNFANAIQKSTELFSKSNTINQVEGQLKTPRNSRRRSSELSTNSSMGELGGNKQSNHTISKRKSSISSDITVKINQSRDQVQSSRSRRGSSTSLSNSSDNGSENQADENPVGRQISSAKSSKVPKLNEERDEYESSRVRKRRSSVSSSSSSEKEADMRVSIIRPSELSPKDVKINQSSCQLQNSYGRKGSSTSLSNTSDDDCDEQVVENSDSGRMSSETSLKGLRLNQEKSEAKTSRARKQRPSISSSSSSENEADSRISKNHPSELSLENVKISKNHGQLQSSTDRRRGSSTSSTNMSDDGCDKQTAENSDGGRTSSKKSLKGFNLEKSGTKTSRARRDSSSVSSSSSSENKADSSISEKHPAKLSSRNIKNKQNGGQGQSSRDKRVTSLSSNASDDVRNSQSADNHPSKVISRKLENNQIEDGFKKSKTTRRRSTASSSTSFEDEQNTGKSETSLHSPTKTDNNSVVLSKPSNKLINDVTLLQTPSFMKSLKSKPTSTPFFKRKDTLSTSLASDHEENVNEREVNDDDDDDDDSCNSEEENSVNEKVDHYKSRVVPDALNKIKLKLYEGIRSEQFEEDLLFVEDISDNDEIWMAQCPKSLKVESLLGSKFHLHGKTKLSASTKDGEKNMPFEAFSSLLSNVDAENVSSNTTVSNVYCLIPSRKQKNLKLKVIEPKGTIKIEERILLPTPNTIKFTSSTEVVLPESLKIRHPLLGSDFSEQLKALEYLNRSSQSFGQNISSKYGFDKNTSISSSSKKKKKKKSHTTTAMDDSVVENAGEYNWMSNLLDTPDAPDSSSKSHKKKKKKKRDRENLQEEEAVKMNCGSEEDEAEQTMSPHILNYSVDVDDLGSSSKSKKKKHKMKHKGSLDTSNSYSNIAGDTDDNYHGSSGNLEQLKESDKDPIVHKKKKKRKHKHVDK